MNNIHTDLCTHHMYIQNDCKRVCQPQCHMNLALRDMVKEEIQKMLNVNFIYPISNSEWISPLVVVPKSEWQVADLC